MKKLIKALTTQEQRIAIVRNLETLKQRIPLFDFGREKKSLSDFPSPYRLHLGCGNINIKGFCNVDVMQTSGVDIRDDIRQLSKFPNNSASEIYACHVLEHFSHEEINPILKRWFDVLQPNGIIRISVPDIDKIVRIYNKNPDHFNTPGNSPWIGLIYGGQSTPYDYHKTGFNFCWLKHLLEHCGFEQCEEYPHEPHFCDGVIDASVAKEPFGEHFSLNIMARKPK